MKQNGLRNLNCLHHPIEDWGEAGVVWGVGHFIEAYKILSKIYDSDVMGSIELGEEPHEGTQTRFNQGCRLYPRQQSS